MTPAALPLNASSIAFIIYASTSMKVHGKAKILLIKNRKGVMSEEPIDIGVQPEQCRVYSFQDMSTTGSSFGGGAMTSQQVADIDLSFEV